MTIKISKMKLKYLDKIKEISNECYDLEYHENKNIFIQAMNIYSEGCLVAIDDNIIAGYAIFHPFKKNSVRSINTQIDTIDDGDCMYIHDIAISRNFRGKGIPGLFMKEIDRQCKKQEIKVQSLVAVQNSENIWKKYGFKTTKKIKYGHANVYYMIKMIQI